MSRIRCLFAAGLWLWAGVVAGAEPIRVGILVSHEGPPYQDTVSGFRQALTQSGLNVDIEVHALQGDDSKAGAALRRERERHSRLLFTVGGLATQAVLKEGMDVPVVAGMVLAPGELKGRPGVTGVVLELPIETELNWLHRLLPGVRRVGVLYNSPENQLRANQAAVAAKSLGFELQSRRVDSPRDLPQGLEGLAGKADVFLGFNDSMVVNPQTAQSLLLFSFRNRIPFVGLSRSWVKAGALYALERDYPDMGRQCGEQAVKILSGLPIASVPVEAPRQVGYSLNLRVARQLKIEFPPSVVKGAQEVFD